MIAIGIAIIATIVSFISLLALRREKKQREKEFIEVRERLRVLEPWLTWEETL